MYTFEDLEYEKMEEILDWYKRGSVSVSEVHTHMKRIGFDFIGYKIVKYSDCKIPEGWVSCSYDPNKYMILPLSNKGTGINYIRYYFNKFLTWAFLEKGIIESKLITKYCDCSCADKCPNGKLGSQSKCCILVRK